MRILRWVLLVLALVIAYGLFDPDSPTEQSSLAGPVKIQGQPAAPGPAVSAATLDPIPSRNASYVSFHDIYYGSDSPQPAGTEQVLDIYLPYPTLAVPLPDPVPVILFLHGLGNVGSDEDLNDLTFFKPLLDNGIAIVTADYGGWSATSDQNIFPVPQEDIAECIHWMHSNALSYGGGWDPNKLGIMGQSYGGTVGSCVAYGNFGSPPSPRPAAFISLNGMLDWTAFDDAKGREIVRHFGKNKTKTSEVDPIQLANASGLKILLDWPIGVPGQPQPPPAYAWANGSKGSGTPGEITDPHHTYFAEELVEILTAPPFSDSDSRFASTSSLVMDPIAQWFLDIVQ